MSRLHDHRRLILVCATVLAALVLVGVAVALAKSQHDARRTLEQRFASGSGTAAALVQTIVDQAYAGDRAVGEQYLSKGKLSAADLSRARARTGAQGIVVLDAQGRPIAASPAGAELGAGPGDHRSQALAGRPSISGGLRGPRGPLLEVAVPFAADGGVRALVVQTPLGQVQKVLGPYLRRISALSDRRAVIVDHRHGDRLLADSHPGTPLSPDLTDQLSGAPPDMSGRFGDGRGYLASSPITGTPWTLVRTASASSLFDPVDGWQTTVAWVLLAVLVAALALVAILADRASRAAERARAASEAKSAFLASMSHELRTPMTTVMGFSEMLAAGRLGELTDRQQETVGHIHASSRHLNQLISEALDLSRVEEGRIHFAVEDVRPDLLVAEVAQTMGGLADDRDITIDVEAPDIGLWRMDPSRFKQVLYNLIGNAVKFTEAGGHVRVRLWRDEATGELGLEVTDTGAGIAPEDLDRIFLPFEQGGSGRNGGAGLGLAISHRIVDAQGGRIAVRSSVGEGSTFEVTLPLEPA